jgi:hypothetical protein
MLGRTFSLYGRLKKKREEHLSVAEIEPRFLGRLTCSLKNTPTPLSEYVFRKDAV